MVSVLHSGLGEGERELAWQRARLGLNRVVLGTRSLVFNPVADLGLIVVDEEHDTSFKQQEGFRYSARDLAVVRARRAGCPVLLGSATPSLESLRNVQQGRYRHLELTRRAGDARPPAIDLLDVRDQPLQAGLCVPLVQELARTLEAGEQAMIFLNRRGYAPVLACYSCGWVSDCPRCDAHQTLHRASNLLWCHHCGSQRRVPPSCPECGEADLHPLGQGTEQVEDFLAGRFPDVPLIRVDRDATARKGSLDRLLARVHDSQTALLVGTQMLAKGHHFPRVTLVGVLDADGGLFSADFRATERMAQLLMQVAGRAGRGERPGKVLIQTRYPEHPLLQTLVREGYDAFAQAALRERAEAHYPPFAHQALLRAEANRPGPPDDFLEQVAAWLRQLPDLQVELWGPVPAPMARRVGRHRAHLLLQADRRAQLHPVLSALQHHLAQWKGARKVRWSLDVDPVDTY
jgi:primosomal protein N' (replication factor Y)